MTRYREAWEQFRSTLAEGEAKEELKGEPGAEISPKAVYLFDESEKLFGFLAAVLGEVDVNVLPVEIGALDPAGLRKQLDSLLKSGRWGLLLVKA